MNDPELKQPDDMNPETRALQAERNPAGETTRGRSTKRVLVVVLIFACAAGLAAAGWAFGWKDQLQLIAGPKLVEVTGTVEYKGKPVTIGYVATEPIDTNLMGAIGPLDKEGRFTLMTDVGGRYEQGAYFGKHKFLVMSVFSSGPSATALVPVRYTEVEQTPLTIDVSSDPKKNQLEFKLVGELASQRQSPQEQSPQEQSPQEQSPQEQSPQEQ